MLRWLVVVLSGAALLVGVADMGERLDAKILTLTECLQAEHACVGETLSLGFLRVDRVEADEVYVTGQGFVLTLVDWPGGVPESSLRGTKVSVRGTYLGDGRLLAHETMVHRFRRVKEGVGSLVLLLWSVAVARFAFRRWGG